MRLLISGSQIRVSLKILKQVDLGLAVPLAYFQATVAQMRGREIPNQQVGDSNPEH